MNDERTDDEIADPIEHEDEADELLLTAWGVIANAYHGRWEDAPEEWRHAAERWRDQWHEYLRR